MKKLLLFVSLICTQVVLLAQSPNIFNYQSVVRNSGGKLVTKQEIGIQIEILQGSSSGSSVYTETHSKTSNAYGQLDLKIGGGTTTDDFSTIDWNNGPYFIQVKMDITGGTTYELIGTSQILSVPYALHANTVDNISETDPVFEISVAAGISAIDTSEWNNKLNDFTETQTLNDVLTQNNSAGNMNITNLLDPANDQDAATKAYVDALEYQLDLLELRVQLTEGRTISGLISDGVDLYDLFNIGIGVGTLEQEGAMEQALIEAGLIGTVDDIEGNSYKWLRIGDQLWMAENLKTTKYANGDVIPDGTGVGDLLGATEPKYWFAYNDDLNNSNTYGLLYTWHTIKDSRNVCPAGWHVPSDDEWDELAGYGEGYKLKETGTTHWQSPNDGATNETGYTALPGGYRDVFEMLYCLCVL